MNAPGSSDSFDFRHVVLQPTTGCNLNCTYCYLPDRKAQRVMLPEVASAVAQSLEPVPHAVEVLWHGGEPMSCGLTAFRTLIKPFAELRAIGEVHHSLQTNATLITPAWCEFFIDEGFRVGVSIDGPRAQNAARRNWANKPAYNAIMRGIGELHRHEIPFGVIAVVNPWNVDDPHEFYEFFVGLGCTSLNINIEEREGLNRYAAALADEKVRAFWVGLFRAWRANPVLRIREFDDGLGWMEAICGDLSRIIRPVRDMWPTVAFDGSVVVLSPELMAVNENERHHFVVGNVLEAPLGDIVRRAMNAEYVRQFWEGTAECRRICPYYSYCGGGQASNKYFELGTTKGTETAHCRHSRQAVVDAVLNSLRGRISESARGGGAHEFSVRGRTEE